MEEVWFFYCGPFMGSSFDKIFHKKVDTHLRGRVFADSPL